MGTIHYSRAKRPDTGYIKKIIENSFLCEWAIRIEYACGESETGWRLWDTTFFAIRSGESVINALMECYTQHPNSAIRINAEKFRPQTRVLYTVYNPYYQASVAASTPQATTRQYVRDQQPVPSPPGLRT